MGHSELKFKDFYASACAKKLHLSIGLCISYLNNSITLAWQLTVNVYSYLCTSACDLVYVYLCLYECIPQNLFLWQTK